MSGATMTQGRGRGRGKRLAARAAGALAVVLRQWRPALLRSR